MTTWKLARFFSGAGHQVAVYSAECKGHKDQQLVQLFHGQQEGREDMKTSLEAALDDFRPSIVINQMPYDHVIASVLSTKKDYLLLGCLRNTLYSVKLNIGAYAERVLPIFVRFLFRNRLGRSILLLMHKVRHKEELNRILQMHDRFVLFGPPNLDELSYFLPDFDRKKICLVPNSVPSVLDEVPRKEKRILWLGRLTYEQKRADLILPVWRKVSKALPDWRLDIVGDGPALDDIREEIASENLERVSLHGRQEPHEFFKSASVFLMTSAFEGFPNTLVEAQSFGAIPVLFDTFPIGGWMINDRVDGFLIQPFDVDSMAREVVSVARSNNKGQIMMNALGNARRFHIDAVGKKWLTLFEECAHIIPDR